MTDGFLPTTYFVSNGTGLAVKDGAVIEERHLVLFVNGHEFAAFMCSPVEVEAMVLGFLRSEGVIRTPADVALVAHAPGGTCVDVWLRHTIDSVQKTPIRTSGCGGGLTFDDLTALQPALPIGPSITVKAIIERYYEMRAAERLYPIARGVHTSGLCTSEGLLFIGEDVGRHNSVDKLWGKAMQRELDPAGCLIVTTGRISSEMLGKAAKMGVALIASRTSPTSRALELAHTWNMTVIGYIRRNGLRVYTGVERILTSSEEAEAREQKSSTPESGLPGRPAGGSATAGVGLDPPAPSQ